MLHFLDSATDRGAALSGSYDPVLVIASYLVAALAAYSSFLMSERIGVAESRAGRWGWLATGAVTMGVGVWAMHFIAMLALELPLPVSYGLNLTVASVVPIMLASAIALRVMAGAECSRRQYFFAGTLLGAGVGVMHYTGMAAMHFSGKMAYDPVLFTLSIVVAVVLGIAAIYAHNLERGIQGFRNRAELRPLGAAVMGLAVTGMHYTAMQSTYFFPGEGPAVARVDIDSFRLSIGVAAVTGLILVLAIAATMVDKKLKSAGQVAKVTRQRMIEAIEGLSDGFILFDGAGRLELCNSVFRGMYPTLADLLQPGTPYARVMRAWGSLRRPPPDDSFGHRDYVAESLRRFEERRPFNDDSEEEQLQDGRWMYIRQRAVGGGGMVGVWTDITPVKELQEVYERLAHHDPLTGLPNRQLFNDRLDHAAAHARRLGGSLALLYVDLDGFKPVNDRFGHEAGDTVLKEVAMRLQAAVRDSDTVARLGGDEFAVIIEPQGDDESAERVAARILESVAQPIRIGKNQCRVGISIGIAVAAAEDFDRVRFVKLADEAMYEAKSVSGNTYRIRTA